MDKCLFVSDLDGTLLRSDETLSEYTCNTINRLTKEGMIFSYATARSLITAKKVTRGLNVPIPLIVYNGSFIMDNVTEDIIAANYFDGEVSGVFEELLMADIWPVVYSYIDKTEYFSFIPEKCNAGMEAFLKTRKGDKRWREVPSFKELTEGNIMRLDGFGLFVNDMATMVRFYRDVLGFEIKEGEDAGNVYLVKDGTLFLLFGRKDFENMTSAKYEYVKGNNGHFEIALYVDTFEEVDLEYEKAIAKGAVSVLVPTTEPWGQRTCYIADPEGNLVEIGSWNKPYEEK